MTPTLITSPPQFIDELETSWLDIFPLAPGWYILLLLIGIAAYALWRYLKKKDDAQIKLVTASAQAVYDNYNSHKDKVRYLQEANILLRQVAIAKYGRSQIANLSGDAWINFLNKASRKNFNKEQQQLLSEGAYSAQADGDIKKLHKQITQWIEYQYRKGKKT